MTPPSAAPEKRLRTAIDKPVIRRRAPLTRRRTSAFAGSANTAEDYTGPSARNKRGPQDDNGVDGTRITSNPQEEFQIYTEHSLTQFLTYRFFREGYKIGFLRVLFFR